MSLRERSYARGHEIACDHGECRRVFRPRTSRKLDAPILRQRAELYGWSSSQSTTSPGLVIDACPDHAPGARGNA